MLLLHISYSKDTD